MHMVEYYSGIKNEFCHLHMDQPRGRSIKLLHALTYT